MPLPLETTFHNMDHSDAVEARVREKFERLEKLADRLGAFIRAAEEVRDHGTFTYAAEAISDPDAAAFMRPIKR